MRKLFSLITLVLVCACAMNAQSKLGNNAVEASILGHYIIHDEEGESKVKVYKAEDGTYRCQTYGQPVVRNSDGSVRLDEYNQDPALRNIPINEAVIVFGLRYDAEKQKWVDGKIHHPFKRMWKAGCDAWFEDGGKTLIIFGNLFGMGKKTKWEKVD